MFGWIFGIRPDRGEQGRVRIFGIRPGQVGFLAPTYSFAGSTGIGKYSFAGPTWPKKYSLTVLLGEDVLKIYRPEILPEYFSISLAL